MNRLPLIIAIVLLLLPVLYVGSYLALVVPTVLWPRESYGYPPTAYRMGGRFSARLFWPLQQIDRKVRPEAWEEEKLGIDFEDP